MNVSQPDLKTRKMGLESAIETWNELLSNGWELVELQIDKDAASTGPLSVKTGVSIS